MVGQDDNYYKTQNRGFRDGWQSLRRFIIGYPGMFMETFISAAPGKENSVSRVAQPGNFHGKVRPSKGALPQGRVDSRGVAGPTQLARVCIAARGTELWFENAGTVSSTLAFAFNMLRFFSLP